MEISNLSDTEFKTLAYRVLEEIIGYCNSIKKTQAEMKVTLSEMQKNLQEPRVKRMKLRIKSMSWNIKKKKAFNQNSKKKKNN